MFPSRAFTNAPWAPRNASYYHPSSPEAFLATANVQPSSVSISVPLASPAPTPPIPEPVLESPPMSDAKPILHGFDSASSTTVAEPDQKADFVPVSGIAGMSCVKDPQVINRHTADGLVKGLAKGTGNAIAKQDPEEIIKGAVAGYVRGALEGEAVAAQTCIPILPRNEPPKP